MKIFKGPKRPYRTPRRVAASKSVMTLEGGPFDMRDVRLCTAGTLPITVRGESGRYDHTNTWKPV